jgi:ABC-type transport system involved in multi-copper enzyme maturation permease subunit
MKALIEKEIRLLLPAFAAALVLAIAPVWLLPYERWNPRDYSVYFFCFGVALLALSTFGREIGFRTLSFMLAQPLDRLRIWWTKTAVLAVFVAVVFEGWWLSGRLSSLSEPELRVNLGEAWVFVAVLTAGALWMTLLLRQVAAAFWLTLLIPIVTTIVVRAAGGTDWLIGAVLAVCAAAGFFMARRQLVYLQDTAWTGGIVSFAGGRAVAEGSRLRKRRPWGELIRKELQLHEFTLAGIAGLFVVHLGVVALRKLGEHTFGRTTLSMLEMFGAVWLFVPLVAGSQSVAEERQLGTMDGLLCLPVSRRAQYAIKLAFVLVLGGLLSPALLYGVEKIGSAAGTNAHLIPFEPVSTVFLGFLGLSFLGFYASTLTRSVVQAMAAGVVVTVAFLGILDIVSASFYAFGSKLWPLVGFPTLAAAILWLSYGNFKWVFETDRRWRRNIVGLVTVNALICGAIAGVHHRIWEWAMPSEGPHGPPRLPADKPVLLAGYGGVGLAIVLPAGRLWTDRMAYDDGWLSLGGNHFVPGSNWVDAFADASETAATRADGTLWVSEKPRRPWLNDHHPPPEESAPLVQFGAESNWQSLQCYPKLLLKRDGTLWSWEGSDINNKHYDGLRSIAPKRLDADSDWARILRGAHWTYAWKRDGTAWVLVQPARSPDWLNLRAEGLDHAQFRSLNSYPSLPNTELGIRNDGTLWYWTWRSPGPGEVTATNRAGAVWNWHWQRSLGGEKAGSPAPYPNLVQIGKDSDWTSVTSGRFQVLATKTDGSIWRWKLNEGPHMAAVTALIEEPHQLRTHHDWIALGCWLNNPVALAADGSLWYLPTMGVPWGWRDEDSEAWLAPSSRFSEIENILAKK